MPSRPLFIDPCAPAPNKPLRISSPHDFWSLAKQIDGLGGEWTFDIFVARATNFHLSSHAVEMYEPIDTFDRLGLEALLQHHFTTRGLLVPEQGGLTVSFHAFSSIFSTKDGEIPIPSVSDRYVGRHSVRVVGLRDNNTLMFHHGWSGWAQGDGIGYLTREYFDRFAIGAMVSRPFDRGPLADTADDLLSGRIGDKEWLRAWRTPRPHGVIVVDESGHRLEWAQTWSLVYECALEVLSVTLHRGGKRLRVAVGIMSYERDPTCATLTDLFVWPTYRRQGHATRLLNFAIDRATQLGVTQLGVCIWDADCAKGGKEALSFLRQSRCKIAKAQPDGQEQYRATLNLTSGDSRESRLRWPWRSRT